MTTSVTQHQSAAKSTAGTINMINIILLVLNILATIVFGIVSFGIYVIPGVFITIVTWIGMQWFRHTLLLLGDIAAASDAQAVAAFSPTAVV